MPPKDIEARLRDAERDLAALKLQTSDLETRLAVLRTQSDREERGSASVAEPPSLPPNQPAASPLPVPDGPAPALPEEPSPAPPPAVVPSPARFAAETPDPDEDARPARDGLEVQLGRVWFVRIGIGLVLTGLVFLSTYAYQNFIIHWGAAHRVSLLYGVSALLAGFGMVLEQRSRRSLLNYARVVTGGGFAALYYTTYAAHHVTALKVIGDPVLAAVLLTVCAASLFAYAAWRKSSTLTITALILGFYSIAINPVGSLGCFAGLLLAAIGVVFFLRHNWMHAGFTALLGAYASFAYWQGLVNTAPDDPARWFLVGYWLLFTGASLAPGARRIPDTALAAFVAINNILAFLLFSFDPGRFAWHPDLGTYALGFGTVLLLLAVFLQRFPSHPKAVRQVHIAQGLALVTWGISIELSGYHLFISLAVEAALLALAWSRTRWHLFGLFALVVALLSAGLAAHGKLAGETPVPDLAWLVAGAALALGSAFLRRRDTPPAASFPLSIPALVFAALALFIASFGILTDLDAGEAGRWMAGIGCALGAGTLLLDRRWPLPELGWLSQAYAVAGGVLALANGSTAPLLLVAAALLLVPVHLHSWFSARTGNVELRSASRLCEVAFAILFTATLGRCLVEATATTSQLLMALAFLPLAFHVYGTLTRCKGAALAPLLFYLPAAVLVGELATGSTGGHGIESLAVLLAAAAAIAHSTLLTAWKKSTGPTWLREATVPLGAAFWLAWVVAFVGHPQLLLTATGLGLIFLPSAWRVQSHVPILVIFLLTGLGLAAFDPAEPWWAAYLAIPLGFAAHFHLTRGDRAAGHPDRFYDLLAIPVAGALAVIVSRHTLDAFDGRGLAVAWALLAVCFFAVGLGARRRLYRWAGLVMIAATLGHILALDVWELDTVLRIVSFLTLGAVLLGLGFVYNRWESHIKRLL